MLASRAARQGLQPYVQDVARAFTTSRPAGAVPAVADPVAPQGFLAKLFGSGGSRPDTPLTDPLPAYQHAPAVAPPSSKPQLESNTLPNGAKIASEATFGPTATVGLFVGSGSVYEQPGESGTSHLLEYLAFKTTHNRTNFRLTRELENLGANMVASASREQMAYSVDVIRTNLAEAVEVLIDTVLNPCFHHWEVEEQVKRLEADLKQAADNPQIGLMEGLHNVAFQGALARPLLATKEQLKKITPASLAEFVARNYTPDRMVLAGAGMMHSELLGVAEPLLSTLPGKSGGPEPSSTYVGGDYRRSDPSELTHMMVAFEAPGGWRNFKGSVVTTVLQFLLGGGGSFSTGGPGKGMHSRLYRRVLNRHAFMNTCTAFTNMYNDTGLVGIFASVESSHAAQSVDILSKELLDLVKDVPGEDLERAKNAALSAVLMSLESRAVVSEDIGRQILTFGHRKPVEEYTQAIKSVKPGDVAKLMTSVLKGPVTLAAQGNIADIPRYDALASRFRV